MWIMYRTPDRVSLEGKFWGGVVCIMCAPRRIHSLVSGQKKRHWNEKGIGKEEKGKEERRS